MVTPLPRLMPRPRSHRSDPARSYYSRERVQSHRDPSRGLLRTHDYVAADSGFDVGDAFPVRSRPLTVSVTVRRDDATAQGIIFEMGDSTTGIAVWIAGNHEDIVACAGDVGAGGVSSTASNVLLADGQEAHIVFSVIPGSGQFRLWVNGELRDRDVSTTTPMPNGWGADSAAGVGEVSGTVSARVPAPDRITLTGASIVSRVSLFDGQRPRQFNAGVVSVVVDLGALLYEDGNFITTEAGDHLIAE